MGSHDFIQFPPTLGEFSPRTWLLLGEIQAAISHIKLLPIPWGDSAALRRLYLAKGVHSTTAIEGNSFTEEEVLSIIDRRLKAPPSREYQQRQIDNMVAAFSSISGTSAPFSLELLNSYHTIVLDTLKDSLAKEVEIGALRSHRVIVGRYLAPPPEDCARLIARYCDWLNQEMPAPAGYETAAQIVKALVAHVYFAWIHPYGDGNGRMARLLEFLILLRAGAPEISAHLLSNFYNKTRDQYYRHLQDSHGEFRDGAYPKEGNLQGFIEYALQGFKDQLAEQLGHIAFIQLLRIWHDSIHSEFSRLYGAKLSPTKQRQKQLILELTDHRLGIAVRKEQIATISGKLARAYAQLSPKTIQRDLNALLALGLLKQVEKGYLPNIEMLVGLSPLA